jgi:hypothetical protein
MSSASSSAHNLKLHKGYGVLLYLKLSSYTFIMTAITLEIPDELISQIMQLGDRFPEWLMVNLPDSNLYSPVSSLSDEEVRSLARLKLSENQNDRLGELQAKGKTSDLAEIERYELLALLQIYQFGQLRKSEAIAESAKRGFPCEQLMTEL